MTPRALLSAATLLALEACPSAKPEAAALVASVEQYHRASNDERPARVDAIGRLGCQDDEVCAAKALCVEAATETARALRIKQDAEATLAQLEAGKLDRVDPAVGALSARLDEASDLLKRGRDAMPACDHKILVLRERYGL